MRLLCFSFVLICCFSACGLLSKSDYEPGPDKQAVGALSGAVTGAGAGAVTGFQLSAGAGPGAAVGAGFGAIAGGIKGILQDIYEEDLEELRRKAEHEQDIAYAHEILSEHYTRRIDLHPARDIYPADWFFHGDEANLQPEAHVLVQEIARLNKKRFPWSRLIVTSYVKTTDPNSEFSRYLAKERAREFGNYLVRYGIQPKRVVAQAVLVDAPVLVDPNDDPKRYSQAIELILEDR